jgi:DNA topoisomerase-1
VVAAKSRADQAGHDAENGTGVISPRDLVYLLDVVPGIRRRRIGRQFRFLDSQGRPIRDSTTLARIKSLAIPPAWTDVWISPEARSHLQATGRDARGRKQYRYHPRWREFRDENKYHRTIAFGEALPRIRRRVDEDLRLPGLPQEKVLAALVRVLDSTLIRIGNLEYARSNNSFGLTTLRDRHVSVNGSSASFEFRGKSGKRHKLSLQDPRLARVIKRCRDLPGYDLFQYFDEDGARRRVTSSDVNAYIRDAAGDDFSTKDFRTWNGTVLAAQALREAGAFSSQREARQTLVEVTREVASQLGNTPAVCRRCYIHPEVVGVYLDEGLQKLRIVTRAGADPSGLNAVERAVLRFLRGRATASADNGSRRLAKSNGATAAR